MSAIRIRASICLCAVLAAVGAACSGDARRVASPGPLNVRIGTFIPKIPGAVTGIGSLIELLSTEPLVSTGWDGRPVFRLAESAQYSEDGRELTLKLRANIKFHNGEVMSAERVRELLSARFATQTKRVTAVEAPTADSILLRLPSPRALDLVELTDFAVADDKRRELRTGPFRIVSSDPDIVMAPFADYHQGKPAVERLEIKLYQSHRAAWTAMMRNEVNFLHEVNREAIDFIQTGGNIRTYRLLRPYYFLLGFNLGHPTLRQREVRIALNEAVDRDEVVRNGMLQQGRVADGPFWPHHWAHVDSVNPHVFNPEAAKLRLDAAGVRVSPSGNARAMPSRFSFECLILQGDSRFERIALVLQRQLANIGVDMRVVPVAYQELVKRLPAGKFDAFLFEMTTGRQLTWVYRFWHSPAPDSVRLLGSGYTGADEPLERMRTATTDEDVRLAVADVMRAMRDDPPAVFLAWPYEARAVDASIHVPYESERDIFGTLWQARRAGENGADDR